MKIDRFVTKTWQGHIDISKDTIDQYDGWVKFEKSLDPVGADKSTTQEGWQYIFKQTDKEPSWLISLKSSISKIREEIGCLRVKTIWTVDYNRGGYQDPHFHNIGVASMITIIINLQGYGDLILQDPRPIATAQTVGFADIVKLTPGDWIAIPAYLIHNSRPCTNHRSILVMDVFVESL